LVTLYGSYNEAALKGVALALVRFDDAGNPSGYEIILPENTDKNRPFTLQEMNYYGSGIWPRRPFDVTVSAEGWIYMSMGGGRILVLRPR
jgi:hypothetical protein